MMPPPPVGMSPKFPAGLHLLERMGCKEFQMRYSDDEQPTVWFAVARFALGWETAAALHPEQALERLLTQAIDGGECRLCGRPTGLDPEGGSERTAQALGVRLPVCWWTWTPATGQYRPGCGIRV